MGVEARTIEQNWDNMVTASRAHPAGTFTDLEHRTQILNAKTAITGYQFFLLPVIDTPPEPLLPFDSENPSLMPLAIVGKLDSGEENDQLLSQAPPSVQNGTDEAYRLLQLRSNKLGSLADQMHSTTLLAFFIKSLKENGACYVVPNDGFSEHNFAAFEDMIRQHYPEYSPSPKE